MTNYIFQDETLEFSWTGMHVVLTFYYTYSVSEIINYFFRDTKPIVVEIIEINDYFFERTKNI